MNFFFFRFKHQFQVLHSAVNLDFVRLRFWLNALIRIKGEIRWIKSAKNRFIFGKKFGTNKYLAVLFRTIAKQKRFFFLPQKNQIFFFWLTEMLKRKCILVKFSHHLLVWATDLNRCNQGNNCCSPSLCNVNLLRMQLCFVHFFFGCKTAFSFTVDFWKKTRYGNGLLNPAQHYHHIILSHFAKKEPRVVNWTFMCSKSLVESMRSTAKYSNISYISAKIFRFLWIPVQAEQQYR